MKRLPFLRCLMLNARTTARGTGCLAAIWATRPNERLVRARITPAGPYDTQMRRTECYAGCREPKAVTPLGVWGNSPHPLAETTPEFWIDPGTAGASGSRLIEGGTWNALTTLAIHVTDADTGDINRWADHFARPVRHRRALPDRRS